MTDGFLYSVSFSDSSGNVFAEVRNSDPMLYLCERVVAMRNCCSARANKIMLAIGLRLASVSVHWVSPLAGERRKEPIRKTRNFVGLLKNRLGRCSLPPPTFFQLASPKSGSNAKIVQQNTIRPCTVQPR